MGDTKSERARRASLAHSEKPVESDREPHQEEPNEAMPFDDALRTILAAPPRPKAPAKPKDRRAKGKPDT